jgi:ubiquinone/menaquinone biosynthesis C-methylase UbiE
MRIQDSHKIQSSEANWWEPNGGFFGPDYKRADESLHGYLPSKPLTLAKRTAREVDGVIRFLGLMPGASILDAPCGYGRHSISLAAMGFKVTGVDINSVFLDMAREAKPVRSSLSFIRDDLRALDHIHNFSQDAVINMFFSFGFFNFESDNLRVLESFYRVLKSNGKLLIHTDVSPEIISSGRYRLIEERSFGNGLLKIEELFDSVNRILHGTWKLEDETGIKELTPYAMHIYSQEEYAAFLKFAGFREIKFFGSFEGELFGASSEELIIVATKK